MILTNFFFGDNFNKRINTQGEFDSLTIEENDSIFLNGTFYGSLNIDQDSVSIHGGGINGDVDVSTFTDELDGTYSKTMSQPKWLFKDESVMKMSETDWIATISNPVANQININHSDVSSYSDIVGSILVHKYRSWAVNKYIVTAYNDAGLITLDKDLETSFTNASYLKLLGKTDYFVDNNEFAYEGGKLYIKSAAEPSGITEAVIDDLITVSSDNFTLQSSTLKNFFRRGIVRNSGNNIKVLNSTIKEGRESGILLLGFEETATIKFNNIHDCGFNGVFSYTTHVPNISSNNVYNIGMQGNYGYRQTDELFIEGNTGIYFAAPNDEDDYSDGGTTERNVLYNISYCGISIRGRNNLIQKNIIHDCMERFTDGGGIYSFGGNFNANVTDAFNNTYKNNFVYNITGGNEGFPSKTPDGRAIHFDDETIQGNVIDNTCYNNTKISQVKGKDHVVTGNTFVHSGDGWNWINLGAQTTPTVNDGNTWNNNITVSKDALKPSIYANMIDVDPDYNPYDNGGEADNNYYINPYSTLIAHDENAGDLTLAQLQTLYGQDANSIEHTDYITAPGDPDNEVLLITNPADTVLNGNAPAGSWKDVDGNTVTDYAIDPWESLVLLKDLP